MARNEMGNGSDFIYFYDESTNGWVYGVPPRSEADFQRSITETSSFFLRSYSAASSDVFPASYFPDESPQPSFSISLPSPPLPAGSPGRLSDIPSSSSRSQRGRPSRVSAAVSIFPPRASPFEGGGSAEQSCPSGSMLLTPRPEFRFEMGSPAMKRTLSRKDGEHSSFTRLPIRCPLRANMET